MTDSDVEIAVAKVLHAADRSGPWELCANQAAWIKWARAAVAAVRKADAKQER